MSVDEDKESGGRSKFHLRPNVPLKEDIYSFVTKIKSLFKLRGKWGSGRTPVVGFCFYSIDHAAVVKLPQRPTILQDSVLPS